MPPKCKENIEALAGGSLSNAASDRPADAFRARVCACGLPARPGDREDNGRDEQRRDQAGSRRVRACARRITRIRWSCVSAPTSRCELDAGIDLSPFQIAYQTYGTLNAARSNAVLVCHALTGDQHVNNVHPVTGKNGWWETMVGPGKPIDTDRYFVICSNVVGGCMGYDRPGLDQSEDRQALGPRFSRSSPSATWCARRRC